MSPIRKSRLRAGLSQTEVAGAMGKGHAWLSYCENGVIPVSPALEAHILRTIDRLVEFNKVTRANRERLVADLALPPFAGDAFR